MAATNSAVMLPEHVVYAAEVQARMRGMSLEEWVTWAVTDRLDTTEGARAFFERRSAGANRELFRKVLDRVPDCPPMPGDELEP